ncbi:MAG: FkbM family methyltransferase [Clostridia bacterium]|nr:FkbM family methyltransferase [Clostridia bacterium]
MDTYFENTKIDFIKYDIEGSERSALIGAKKLIKRDRPDMVVSLYHRSSDLFELPLLINEICSDYKLSLMRPRYIPAWDVVLIAEKK